MHWLPVSSSRFAFLAPRPRSRWLNGRGHGSPCAFFSFLCPMIRARGKDQAGSRFTNHLIPEGRKKKRISLIALIIIRPTRYVCVADLRLLHTANQQWHCRPAGLTVCPVFYGVLLLQDSKSTAGATVVGYIYTVHVQCVSGYLKLTTELLLPLSWEKKIARL
jgi:hypothetical protein